MDADFRFPSIYVPSTCTHRARPAPASVPVTRAGPPPGGPVRSTPERTGPVRISPRERLVSVPPDFGTYA